jgi:hypothetical protein
MANEKAAASNKPIQVFRVRGISASVFENHAKSRDRSLTFYKVSLQRTYRDDGEFKTTASLSRDDLPIAALLLDRAWQFILETEAANRSVDDDESEG